MSQCPDPVPTGLFKAYVTDYEKFKLEKGLIDFHDMLEMGLKVDGPPVSIAFIDEAQDLTPLQIAAVERWFKDCDEIIIAGDDDQCIYKWSGAEPEWLIGLKDKAGDHEILSQSYRVPGMAHAIANRIITRNKQRVEKIYKPMSKRGAVMMGNKIKAIDQIKKTIADKRNRVFVLVRNRFLIPQWSSPLMREAIPFSVEGKGSGGPLGKPKLCSCAMACNRLLEGGDITATEWRSILDYIPASMPYMIKGVKVRSKKNQNSLSLDELKIHWGLKDFADYLEKHGPTSVLTKNTQPEQRIYLAQLIQAGYDLVKAQKYPPVRITTIHGSKGREANLVIIVPDMARLTWNEYITNEEAENRVAYVAVTRTKWALFFVQRETQMYYPYEDYLHQKKEVEANKKEGGLWGV
jgi:DNA helicase-2/ATP-dependent DNA helicase PcrA